MKALDEYESKPIGELIEIYQKATDGGEKRRKALFALILRFRKDLLNKCEILCSRFGHDCTVAEIIAENAFKAYAKKGNFQPERGKGKNIEDSFKLYLYSIAKNELTNYYRELEKKANGYYYDGSEKVITELPPIDIDTLETEARIRYEIINSLPPSHRTVYLTYTAYERIGCNLPEKLRMELRQALGNVSQSTVRSYKKEAIDKIKEGLKVMQLTIQSEK